MRRILLCLAAVALATTGCDRRTGVPDPETLYGTWTLTRESLDRVRSMGFERAEQRDHRIVLSADGRCDFFSYWHFSSRPDEYRVGDYYPAGASCSWRTLDVEVAARRTYVLGALELNIWDRTGAVHRAASVDLQVERLDGVLFLLATSGHPDENGPRFLYQRVAR